MSATELIPLRHWARPAAYEQANGRGSKEHDVRPVRNSQEAFERAVARELLGDCC